MSFILDALKKSETDRQRQSGPALFEVKVAQPKAGFPMWAIAIVVLLAINMVIVGWLLLRRSSHSDEATVQNVQPPAAVSQPPPTTAPNPGAQLPPANTQPVPTNSAPPPTQNASYPQQAYSPPPPAEDRGQNEPTLGARGGTGNYVGANEAGNPGMTRGAGNPATGQGDGAGNGNSIGRTGSGASSAGAAGATADAGNESSGATNPDDYAPAQDPGSPIFKGHVRRGTESGLMLYQDLAVTNGSNLPELRLDMHVYDPKPQNRFALINMHKVVEGQIVKDGVKVEAITPDGVVLSHNGSKFLLPRE